MKNIHTIRRARVERLGIGALTIIAFGATGCLGGSYTTSRDKTLKGDGIGTALPLPAPPAGMTVSPPVKI